MTTFEEFEIIAQSRFENEKKSSPETCRVGQTYFNTLNEIKPGIASEILGTAVDPFYKNRITQVVRDFISDRWSEE
jgi:hypothetical protein